MNAGCTEAHCADPSLDQDRPSTGSVSPKRPWPMERKVRKELDA